MQINLKTQRLIKVNKITGAEIQTLCFRYGYEWKNGMQILRHPTNEKHYLLLIDFQEKVIDSRPMFLELDYYVIPQDQEKRILFNRMLTAMLCKYKKPNPGTTKANVINVAVPEFGARRLPKLEPNPKYPPIFKKKYQREKVDIMESYDDLEIIDA